MACLACNRMLSKVQKYILVCENQKGLCAKEVLNIVSYNSSHNFLIKSKNSDSIYSSNVHCIHCVLRYFPLRQKNMKIICKQAYTSTFALHATVSIDIADLYPIISKRFGILNCLHHQIIRVKENMKQLLIFP